MTKRLVDTLIKKGYKYVIRTGKTEFSATKAEMPFKDDDDFDVYECSKNETVKDLAVGTTYDLSKL